jgi:hypothetical protein
MKLGIGIPTFRRPVLLRRCVEKLQALTTTPHEIVVADDGSGDETSRTLAALPVAYMAGGNMGVCWNKNRLLVTLHELMKCDIIVLMEDDTFPNARGWESPWIEAAQKFGHVNLAGVWFRNKFLSGGGAPNDPVRSESTSGQVTAFNREALDTVGYMDTRFRGYGYGHVDHSFRMVRAGYGGIILDGRPVYFLIEGAITVTADESNKNEAELAANARVFAESQNGPVFRPPFRSHTEREQLEAEVRSLKRGANPAGPHSPRLTAGVSDLVCFLDGFDSGVVRGWASLKPDAMERQIGLCVLIDDESVGTLCCDRPRPDVRNAGFPLMSGYEFRIPDRFLDGRPHRLELREQDIPVPFGHQGLLRREFEFQMARRSAQCVQSS